MSDKRCTVKSDHFASPSRKRGSVHAKGSSGSSGNESTSGTESKRITVNLGVLEANINEFREYATTKMSDLPLPMKDKLMAFGKLAGHMHDSSSYESVINLVTTSFGDVSNIVPGTVSAFFYGCFADNNFEGVQHCSAHCSGNLPLPNIRGWQFCDKTVILLTGKGVFDVRHTVDDTKEAIIHVIDGEYHGFTHDQILDLKERGIEKVSIDVVNGDRYELISTSIPVDDLEIAGAVSSSRSSSQYDTSTGNREIQSSNNTHTISDNTSSSNGHVNYGNIPRSSNGRQNHANSQMNSEFSNTGKSEQEWGWGSIIAIIILIIIILVLLWAAWLWSKGSFNSAPDAWSSASASTETVTQHTYGGPHMIV